jgi:hypothetical protein
MRSHLYTLFLALVVVASSWSAFGVVGVGILIVAIVLALAGYFRLSSAWPPGVRWTTHGLLLLILIGLLLPAISPAREAARRMQCSNNLRQISLALYTYENHYGSLPPAYIADTNGKPMHSWRVLILPYLERKDLYNQYNFNEPWDGPNNKKLLDARPSFYACPSDEEAYRKDQAQTSYVAVVGSNAAWSNKRPHRHNDSGFNEKASSTIMLVETAGTGINWTEPKDLSLDTLQAATSRPGTVAVSSMHSGHYYYHGLIYDYEYDSPNSAYVALVDGSVRFLPAGTVSSKTLQKLLTIGGYDEDEVDKEAAHSGPYRQVQFKAKLRWWSCVNLAVLVVSVGLLLHRTVRARKRPEKPAAEEME